MIMASFDDVVKGGNAVANVIAAGIIPAGLEMMDKTLVAHGRAFRQCRLRSDAEAILLCESDGSAKEVEDEIAHDVAVLQAVRSQRDGGVATEAERLRFWSGRKNAFPAAGRISPDYYCMDGTIPRKKLAQVLLGIAEMEKKYSCVAPTSSMPATAICHPLILFDANYGR